ncbi:unnamed protein product [Prorocentrum cordatum]|uniref:Uncharacterized protein n=1 Tax=Prorocentrum cordatum TaxID=2364126 RepID=A0ABN9U8X1_9DINO|nr:unnamed protein product [Polarella glacialis]
MALCGARGDCAPLAAAASLVEAAVRGAAPAKAPRRTVAAVARAAVSASFFKLADAPVPPAATRVGAVADVRPSVVALLGPLRRRRRAARPAAAGELAEVGSPVAAAACAAGAAEAVRAGTGLVLTAGVAPEVPGIAEAGRRQTCVGGGPAAASASAAAELVAPPSAPAAGRAGGSAATLDDVQALAVSMVEQAGEAPWHSAEVRHVLEALRPNDDTITRIVLLYHTCNYIPPRHAEQKKLSLGRPPVAHEAYSSRVADAAEGFGGTHTVLPAVQGMYPVWASRGYGSWVRLRSPSPVPLALARLSRARSAKDAEVRRMARADAALKKHMAAFVRVWRERRRQDSRSTSKVVQNTVTEAAGAGGAGHLAIVGARTPKQDVQNPHCTLSVVGARRRVCVQAGDAVELEDQQGRKAEVLGKATLRVGREHFLHSEWAADLPLSLPSSRLSLRKATVQVRIESIHAAGARIGELPGDPLKGIEASLARLHKGRPKHCPVAELMYRLGRELKREEHEITPLVHRLVTLNWLEDVRDLELAEDRHWERWGFPEKLVVLIKAELLELSENNFLKGWENVTSSVTSRLTSIFAWT